MVNAWDRDTTLLSGPRGRRLCMQLVSRYLGFPGPHGWYGALVGTDRLLETIEAATNGQLLAELASASEQAVMLGALTDTVDNAWHWGEPDEEDQALAQPPIARALQPIARAVAASPAAAWWVEPLAPDRQLYVQWLDSPRLEPPQLAGAADELGNWRQHTVADETGAEDAPDDPLAAITGVWWSSPGWPARLPVTTRALFAGAAVKLWLEEDGSGNTVARCWPLRARQRPRVYEIAEPQDWSALATRYPLVVDRARRRTWRPATGWSGGWVIPDWPAVAADYDAVHLTVAGYLTTAGRALPAGERRTVLAGWNPDETYWLTDLLQQHGPPTEWHLQEPETETAPITWTATPRADR